MSDQNSALGAQVLANKSSLSFFRYIKKSNNQHLFGFFGFVEANLLNYRLVLAGPIVGLRMISQVVISFKTFFSSLLVHLSLN